MLPASFVESLATLVHVRIDRLGKNQAFVDIVDIDASTGVVQHRFVVGLKS